MSKLIQSSESVAEGRDAREGEGRFGDDVVGKWRGEGKEVGGWGRWEAVEKEADCGKDG